MVRMFKKGQTTIEYVVLVIIVIGALIAIGGYFKRGIQGRWKGAMDDIGDQYDPRYSESSIRHALIQSSNTRIYAVGGGGENWTMREDDSLTIETKQGNVTVRSY